MAEKDWSLGFWQFLEEPVPCSLSVCCFLCGCCCLGVGVIQYRNQKQLDGEGKYMTLLGPCIGCCFGAAWNRQQLRQAVGMGEAYWKDCARYAICCLPCMSVQEFKEADVHLTVSEEQPTAS